jgi:hypothetical protein
MCYVMIYFFLNWGSLHGDDHRARGGSDHLSSYNGLIGATLRDGPDHHPAGGADRPAAYGLLGQAVVFYSITQFCNRDSLEPGAGHLP